MSMSKNFCEGGQLPNEGNVFVRGKPVCDDSWGQEEANVVCRFVFLFSLSKYQTNTASFKKTFLLLFLSSFHKGADEIPLSEMKIP